MSPSGTKDIDHYSLLALPSPGYGHSVSTQDIKLAYRRALLRHHPDKSKPPLASSTSSHITAIVKLPISDITTAYQTLLNPTSRAEYDRLLLLQPGKAVSKSRGGQSAETFRSGLEAVDLDDLDYDEVDNIWYRSCRCGERRGFVVTEQDLEAEAKHGELMIGCRGCSLWLNVLFQASDTEPS